MVIEVHLHTIFQRQTPQGLFRQLEVELPQGCTLGDLIQKIAPNIDLEAALFVVNGKTAEPSLSLIDRDVVHLIPALSGG